VDPDPYEMLTKSGRLLEVFRYLWVELSLSTAAHTFELRDGTAPSASGHLALVQRQHLPQVNIKIICNS
jgi:hypothetical protein